MKSASVVQLLKVGHFLFQKQSTFKRIFGLKHDFFKEELDTILRVIIIHMGIIRSRNKFIYVVNTDHYEYITSMFWNYCNEQISLEEMIDHVHVLKIDEAQIIEGNGKALTNSPDAIHILFELKNLLHLKRNRLNKFFDGLSDFIRAEMRIMHVALEELGK